MSDLLINSMLFSLYSLCLRRRFFFSSDSCRIFTLSRGIIRRLLQILAGIYLYSYVEDVNVGIYICGYLQVPAAVAVSCLNYTPGQPHSENTSSLNQIPPSRQSITFTLLNITWFQNLDFRTKHWDCEKFGRKVVTAVANPGFLLERDLTLTQLRPSAVLRSTQPTLSLRVRFIKVTTLDYYGYIWSGVGGLSLLAPWIRYW